MLKLFPIIIISSTIPISEPETFILDNDYSEEAIMFMEKNSPRCSQNPSDILYDLILQELLENGS